MKTLPYGTRVKLLHLTDGNGKPLQGTVMAWNEHHDSATGLTTVDYNVVIDASLQEWKIVPTMPAIVRYEWVTPDQIEVISEASD